MIPLRPLGSERPLSVISPRRNLRPAFGFAGHVCHRPPALSVSRQRRRPPALSAGGRLDRLRCVPLSLVLLLLAGVAATNLGGTPADAAPRGFGRNKVQYESFAWSVLETDHLLVHFYPEERALAERAARFGEEACRQLSLKLDHQLTKKIPFIVYESHADFRQNNVTGELIGEGTGGFTEIFRTRVVLPYSGSEADFEHVVHHELVHAYFFDMLYGGPLRSYFVLQSAFAVPLWFAEGIAEWYSRTWDPEGEMMIRDAALDGSLPPFHRIGGGYFVYKAGYSAVAYLVARYGEEVIPRIIRELDETRDLSVAFQNVTGEPLEKCGEDWLMDVRRVTWPTIEFLEGAESLGRIVSSRARSGGFLNGNPVIAPSGTKVVYLSDRSGTPDLYCLDLTREGSEQRVLARGARERRFESLHPLRSSVGFSSDESMIVLAAAHQEKDALYLVSVRTGRVLREFTPDLDAIERPDWSRNDSRFVFTGMKDGQVDLYLLDADGKELTQLTNDLFEERGPRFSPDGSAIAYACDRGDSASLDLYVIDPQSRMTRRIVEAPRDQRDPAWHGSGREIFYVSEEWGTRDLCSVALDGKSAPKRRSALRGGVDAPSAAWEKNHLVLSAYDGGGWDLVLVDDADTLKALEHPPAEIRPHVWDGRVARRALPDSTRAHGALADSAAASDSTLAAHPTTEDSPVSMDSTFAAVSLPELQDYRSRFRTEWITGSFAYGSGGASGGIQTSVADILGDHRFDAGLQLYRRLEDSDSFVTYSSVGGRLDLDFTAFHVKDYLYDDRTSFGQPVAEENDRRFFSERRWGVATGVTYPFDTFRRATFEVSATRILRTTYTDESRQLGADLESVDAARSDVFLPRLAFAKDNTLWGNWGPVQGSRALVSMTHAVPLGGERLVFGTGLVDARRYARWGRTYSLALRGSAAISFGEDPQEFQVGGPWTIRGYETGDMRGRSTAHGSVEFRYPFIERVQFGWPLRSTFGGIRGALFVDGGTAVDSPRDFRLWGSKGSGISSGLDDLRLGFGAGVRARIAFIPLRLDVGWPTDLVTTGKPRWHLSIGLEP